MSPYSLSDLSQTPLSSRYFQLRSNSLPDGTHSPIPDEIDITADMILAGIRVLEEGEDEAITLDRWHDEFFWQWFVLVSPVVPRKLSHPYVAYP